MDGDFLVNLSGVAVGVVSAVFAGVQILLARRAKREAERARAEEDEARRETARAKAIVESWGAVISRTLERTEESLLSFRESIDDMDSVVWSSSKAQMGSRLDEAHQRLEDLSHQTREFIRTVVHL